MEKERRERQDNKLESAEQGLGESTGEADF